jgi:membrane-bound serine protease (ClpP class)
VIGIASLITAIGGVVAFWRVSALWGFSSTVVVMVLVPVCFNFAIRVMPHTPIGKRLILGAADEETDRAEERRELETLERERSLMGVEGTAATDLRPVGTARLNGERVEVSAESGTIEAGTPVRVVSVSGKLIKVRPIA